MNHRNTARRPAGPGCPHTAAWPYHLPALAQGCTCLPDPMLCWHAGRPCSPVRGDCLCSCNECAAWRGEPFSGPLCPAATGCGHWTCQVIADNHECPIATFLDDPITQAYGLGGDMDEWGRVVTCHVCATLAAWEGEL
jgi:hypothetical protein